MSTEPRRSGLVTSLPNIISLSRLAAAGAFVAFSDVKVRLGLVLAATVTDYLDGWLARRLQSSSRLGALIDPFADRAFVFTAVCVFLFSGMIDTTQYFVLIARDLATAIGLVVAKSIPALRPATFRARLAGKTVTVLQLVTLVAILGAPKALPLLIPIVAIASVIAIADYTLALWRQRARA